MAYTISDLVRTMSTYFQVGTFRLKDVSGVVSLRNADDSDDADLLLGDIEIEGVLNHDGSTVGFRGATPVAMPGTTADIKDALQAVGLLNSGAGATPLNLDSGRITSGQAIIQQDLSHTGSTVGFRNATSSAMPSSTNDIKNSLQTVGLLNATDAATPLNLDGGALTAGAGTFVGTLDVTGNITVSGTVDGVDLQDAIMRTPAATSVDNDLVRYDGTSGKLIHGSGINVPDALNATGDIVTTDGLQTLTQKLLVLPTLDRPYIASFENALHDHQSLNGGNYLDASWVFNAGEVPVPHGGTGADLGATGGTGQIVKQLTVGGDFSVAILGIDEIPTIPLSLSSVIVLQANRQYFANRITIPSGGDIEFTSDCELVFTV